eukprot:m.130065 g.130065  ORF g.130065 m.130065 type:complete len:170 (-) comp15869_c1_seq1:2054-2563(-)
MTEKKHSESGYGGQCLCKAVRFRITAPKANLELYCHCHDCTGYASSLIVPYIMFPFNVDEPEASITVLSGKALLTKLNYTERVNRYFCSKCGTPCFNEVPSLGMCGSFPNVIPDYPYEPTQHVYYRNKRLAFPIQDGLPKHKDLPAAFGGSGEFLDDGYVCEMEGVDKS